MNKVIKWLVGALVVVLFVLYAASAFAAELPERCSNMLVSDLHPDHTDPLHYNHDCIMEQNPNYVAPIVSETPTPPAQSGGTTGSATGNASPQPLPSVEQSVPIVNPNVIFITTAPTSSSMVETQPGTTTTIVVIKEVVRVVEASATSTTEKLDQIIATQVEQTSLLEQLVALIRDLFNFISAILYGNN